ncbi:MAG: YihA family ribosome biogenesis GTP-binding protein [Legionellales bacterium]|nr:YihA family ribosome biogenesis GTP-binding protein [Legionellales bacterium]|tara:strand:+ start:774 stop:1391 length:618 start_codon:yes stop_codon:yes gene_type:complete
MLTMEQLFNQFTFMKSASNLQQCPPDKGIEIAFIGRSNSGKSSAINALVGRGRLAHTSKTPGRTQLINFFEIEESDRRLVDLPGYGYAKVTERIRQQIEKMLSEYFSCRTCLHGVVMLMDIRHPLQPADLQMLNLLNETGRHIHVLLTKSDKLKRGPANATLLKVRHSLQHLNNISVQTFSAMKMFGIEEAQDVLCQWFSFDDED